jgi:transketolase
MKGFIAFIYSIVPFVTMRNFEQIRNDICYQNLNVKIVGVGAGFSYGPYGHTHHGLEDIGIMRTLPNLTIVCPGDPIEASLATEAILKHDGPVYLRLGKSGEPEVHKKNVKFLIGKSILVKKGKDITLLSTSTLLSTALEVAKELERKNHSASVISMHTIKPLDIKSIQNSLDKSKAIFTLEEHSVIGGLGSAVAEVIAESNRKIVFKRIGARDTFTKKVGLQEFMRNAHGLSVNQIAETILSVLKK